MTEQFNSLEVILYCSNTYFLSFYSFLPLLKILNNATKAPSIIVFCFIIEGFGTLRHRSSRNTNKVEKHPQSSSTYLSSLMRPHCNRNIEYRSVDDSSITPLTSNRLIFLSFLFAWNPNKELISQRVRWDYIPHGKGVQLLLMSIINRRIYFLIPIYFSYNVRHESRGISADISFKSGFWYITKRDNS